MRIGIVGSGSMGAAHARGWAATPATIGGFLNRASDSAARLAAQYDAQVYADLDALLADVDVVSICTPTPLHHDQVLQAAAARKHLVLEKPLALSVEQGREMLDACQQAGVQLLMAHVLRFFPAYARVQQIITHGEIGQPGVLRLFRRSSSPQKGWFLDTEQSGGVMLDLMIHDLDYARWLAGPVTRVYAQSTGPNGHASAVLTHASGALSYVEASWAYPPPFFWTGVDITGAEGLIHYDSKAAAAIDLRHYADNTPQQLAYEPAEDPYITQIKTFYHALTEGAPVPVTADDGLAALQIAQAAIESAHSGQAIDLASGI
ncbi:MAG: Gfo/Idh/MocA family oxidoreductase [Anaerolineae bacterium]|nr:Gfo/Idh/MocA family oxidoreductase [Anaerolineae bacterium]